MTKNKTMVNLLTMMIMIIMAIIVTSYILLFIAIFSNNIEMIIKTTALTITSSLILIAFFITLDSLMKG